MSKVRHYRGDVIADYDAVDLNTRTGRLAVQGALQAFVSLPERYPVLKAQARAFAQTGNAKPVRAFATPDDFPTSVIEVLEKFHQTTYYDLGYERVFKMLDMRNSNRSSFDILDVIDGLAFTKTLIGEKARLYKMSGEKENVPIDMYSGGLHWSKILFDDEEYWTLEDNAIAFRNKYYSSKAQDFYDLIDNVAATYDLTWQPGVDTLAAGTEGYTVQRDVRTLNTACVNIMTRCQNLGMGVGPASEFIILAPIQIKDRITNALTNVYQAFSGSPGRLSYNMSPVYTTMLAATDVYYVIFPKNKIVGANRKDLEILTEMSITSYGELAVGWARYAGAIGEIQQIVRCETT